METDSELLLYERLHNNVSFYSYQNKKLKSAPVYSPILHEKQKNHESVCYCICLKTVVFGSFDLFNNKNEI